MIYGINFNGQAIPEAFHRFFPKELKRYRCGRCDTERAGRRPRFGQAMRCESCKEDTLHILMRGMRALLAGVGQSEEERDAMKIQMTNGSRMVHVEPRQTAGGIWYGFYS